MDVTGFHAIDVSAPVTCNINIQPGSTPSVQFSGSESLIKMIRVKVEDGTLDIYSSDDFHIDWNDQVTATITLPSLTALDISGAGSTTVTGDITGNDFKLDISGVGKVTIPNINVTELTADVSGAGKVNLVSGTVQNGHYDLSGTGAIDAFGVQHTDATASVSGAGYIHLSVSDKLNADVSGVGSVRYKGHPNVTSDNSGVGSVTAEN